MKTHPHIRFTFATVLWFDKDKGFGIAEDTIGTKFMLFAQDYEEDPEVGDYVQVEYQVKRTSP